MATSWKRRLAFIPPVVLGVAVMAFAVSNKEGPVQAPPQEIAKSVRIIEAAKVPVVARAIGYGSVKPSNVWNAISRVKGTAVYVNPDFKKGAVLQKGTELVRIDPTDYQLTIAQFEANIRATEAQLKESEVSEANTRSSLAIEENVLSIKKRDLARKEQLKKKGAASVSSVDQARRDSLAQSQQVQNLKNALNLIPTQRNVLEEQKAVYMSQLEAARLDLERTLIVLPYDARISEANVEISQYVQSGSVLGVADAIETSEVEAQVPLSRFGTVLTASSNSSVTVNTSQMMKLADTLSISAIVRLKSGGFGVKWDGRVVRISDTVDPQTRTVGVIVAVDNPYKNTVLGKRPPLVKGMFVEVELLATKPQEAMVIPRVALHGKKVYTVTKENRLAMKPVKVAFSQGNFVAVTHGLSEGEKVIVSDVIPSVEGLLLTPVHDQSLQASLIKEAGREGSVK
ncbi:MAG: HlyD family efflux transporter periplasmic adaptor subunit [Rhodospirillales bacterium]|nr:HlyD family efflux transporter periplasmic adaptor subunit [Rhodospirillales bacterium]